MQLGRCYVIWIAAWCRCAYRHRCRPKAAITNRSANFLQESHGLWVVLIVTGQVATRRFLHPIAFEYSTKVATGSRQPRVGAFSWSLLKVPSQHSNSHHPQSFDHRSIHSTGDRHQSRGITGDRTYDIIFQHALQCSMCIYATITASYDSILGEIKPLTWYRCPSRVESSVLARSTSHIRSTDAD